ncbi:MAG: SDR family NAD(P)-dependent oxidoreductase [Planctomycetota bacterium]|jgi:pteridine reductase
MIDSESQRVALVTGGAVRVGRVLSLGLAEAGYDVVVNYRASAGPAERVAADIAESGRLCSLVRGDLADPATPPALAEHVEERFGRLDLLVNNAAAFDSRPLLDVDAEAWDAVMNLNVRGPHLLVRALAPLLESSRGSVVNIVDLSAFQAWTEYPHHAVSKAALAHLTRVQARALAPRVRVNAVAPGAVLPPDDYSAERTERLRAATPLQALGTPEDVLGAVLYFAQASFVTGQVLAVDGGRLLGPEGPPGE